MTIYGNDKIRCNRCALTKTFYKARTIAELRYEARLEGWRHTDHENLCQKCNQCNEECKAFGKHDWVSGGHITWCRHCGLQR